MINDHNNSIVYVRHFIPLHSVHVFKLFGLHSILKPHERRRYLSDLLFQIILQIVGGSADTRKQVYIVCVLQLKMWSLDQQPLSHH